MTTRNSILLIIKQNQGIEYNFLLNKIAGNYGSLNSARAALSRAVKDLSALGMIRKKENSIFITDKGTASISGEMKGKLLVELNKLVSSPKNYENIDAIVSDLATLIQRSKEDSDLLKAAKSSADFSVSDLRKMQKSIESHLVHLSYLQKIFESQVEQIEKMNFSDSRVLTLNKEGIQKLSLLSDSAGYETITVEAGQEEINELKKHFPDSISRQNSLPLKSAKLEKLLEIATEKNLDLDIYAGQIKMSKRGHTARLTGPFRAVEKLF